MNNGFYTANSLFSMLGTFWNQYFGDSAFIGSLEGGIQDQGAQTYFEFIQRVAAVSRFEIPVFKSQYWYFLTLKQSEQNSGRALVIKYGDTDLAYGDGSIYGGFGKPKDYMFEIDPTLKSALAITNRVTDASLLWMNGTDFEFEDDFIIFKDSPFDNDLIPKRTIVDENGVKVDEEVGLWLYMGQWDIEWVWNQFGFAVQLWLESSEAYKEIVNILYDMKMFGCTDLWFRTILGTMSGVLSIIEPTEVVESIITYPNIKQVVVTDKHTYNVHIDATVTVAVGDTLHAGDTIADTWNITYLNRQNRDYSSVQAIAVGEKFLSGGYKGEFVFNNKSVELEYLGQDRDGKTFVKFELGGYPDEVDKYWAAVQETAKEHGYKTLAELLDTRSAPVGQPMAGNLPASTNPLGFVLENIFKNNLFLVKIRPLHFLNDVSALKVFSYLKQLVPAYSTFMLIMDLTIDKESITLDNDTPTGDEFCEEDASLFPGTSASDTIDEAGSATPGDPSYGDRFVRLTNGDPCNV